MTVSASRPNPTSPETAEDQAMAWVLRLASGQATVADAQALNRWREASDANRRAFAEANLLWDRLGPAARVAAEQQKPDRTPYRLQRPINRRAALAAFATAAAASYLLVQPPFRLWPSASEWAADFRTGTGEQRKVTLFETVSVTLNTETSLSKEASGETAERIRLISGEAAFSTPSLTRQLVVEAGNGIIATHGADFQVRNLDSVVCVTCLSGQVRIRHAQQLVALEGTQQVTYDDRSMREVKPTDPVVTSAWQRGMLIFDNVPLDDVVKEINRYRPGRIILLNQQTARHPVVATFYLDRLNLAIGHLETVFGLRAENLPGGITVLT